MNVKPTNHAVQCEQDLCDHIDWIFDFENRLTLGEMADHRYVLDIDGNACVALRQPEHSSFRPLERLSRSQHFDFK